MDGTAHTTLSTTSGRGHARSGAETPAHSWPMWARIAASAVLVGAPAAQIIDRALFPMDDGHMSLFHALSTNPGMVDAGAVAGMFAPALLIGSVLIWYRLTRARSRIAAGISLASGVLAFTCLALTTGYSYAALGLHQAGLGTQAVADILDGYSGPPATLVITTFEVTASLCILAAAWALWRSHAVPRGSVVLLVLFIVLDMALPLPVDAHYIGLAAMVWMSVSFYIPAPVRHGRPSL